MKFSEMPYARVDCAEVKNELAALTAELKAAADYAAARDAFVRKDKLARHVSTQYNLAYIRHTVNTKDEFYDGEIKFWNGALPEIREAEQNWTLALLASPFRADFAGEFGEIIFTNAEIQLKSFSPEIIPEMQQESNLSQEYEKLLASAQIPFEGGTYTLSQLSPFKNDPDDARRLAAWKAEGQWYNDNAEALDTLYDKLTRLRDAMGKKLGYPDYTRLGYYRMDRNCYDETDVAKFRAAVVKYLVPVADSVRRAQAERLGKSYPMSFADNALLFRSGNARPCGTAEQIVAHAKTFYEELSEETGVFFNRMIDDGLMDLLSTEGKASGGYCTSLEEYEVPFIFANFNGTRGDVETVTHEAGHAFAGWCNRRRVPMETMWPSLEGCEVHSMSMEFFAWPWAEGFFGGDTRKFLYSHLADALTFIPYGTMVDHFQHEVFARPEMTPAQRHEVWKRLSAVYMPWVKMDGEIPFYGEGHGWQRQHHIYSSPFYYIDYCLAQTVALQFLALIQKDQKSAWETYRRYTDLGGSMTFTELLETAGLKSPFDESCLREACDAARKLLDGMDISWIE